MHTCIERRAYFQNASESDSVHRSIAEWSRKNGSVDNRVWTSFWTTYDWTKLAWRSTAACLSALDKFPHRHSSQRKSVPQSKMSNSAQRKWLETDALGKRIDRRRRPPVEDHDEQLNVILVENTVSESQMTPEWDCRLEGWSSEETFERRAWDWFSTSVDRSGKVIGKRDWSVDRWWSVAQMERLVGWEEPVRREQDLSTCHCNRSDSRNDRGDWGDWWSSRCRRIESASERDDRVDVFVSFAYEKDHSLVRRCFS